MPTKTFGQLEVYNSDSGGGPWNIAALDEGDWSYHWAEFKDVDGDGLKDIMTARWVNLGGGLGMESTSAWVRKARRPDTVFFVSPTFEGSNSSYVGKHQQ